MCIIVAVPANTPLPNAETLKECFLSNRDGAGFMYADGKSVRIRKGFMTFEGFMKALKDEQIPEDTGVVLHFRIATHGKVQPSCCHPFPVSSNSDDLKLLRCESRWGVAHNGVIQGRSTSNEWSDTMDFVHRVIAPLSRMNPGFMHSSDAQEMLEGACKSKLAILDNAGDMMLVGEFIEDDGVFYSNTSYLPLRTNWSSYGNFWQSYEPAEWDDLPELMDNLKFEACQLCPMAEDCARWGEECESEAESVAMCADYSGMDVWDVADCVGASMSDVMSEVEGREVAFEL